MAEPAAEGRIRLSEVQFTSLAYVLRPEGDGENDFALRVLRRYEWGFADSLPRGAEKNGRKMPVFVRAISAHSRESCDTCKHYLRTIDLTKDGKRRAEADDLAAIPLTCGQRKRLRADLHESFGSVDFHQKVSGIAPKQFNLDLRVACSFWTFREAVAHFLQGDPTGIGNREHYRRTP